MMKPDKVITNDKIKITKEHLEMLDMYQLRVGVDGEEDWIGVPKHPYDYYQGLDWYKASDLVEDDFMKLEQYFIILRDKNKL